MAQQGQPQIDLSKIPNLPGYSLKQKRVANKRDQRFHVLRDSSGGPVICEKEEGGARPGLPDKVKTVCVPRPADTRRVGDTFPESTTQEEHNSKVSYETTVVPAWELMDKVVLRWYGFFRESVPETNLETNRMRQCNVMFYLEDDTCHITERKQENSGIPQGNLLRRHRFPSEERGFLEWDELQVGGMLNVYGKSIYIHSCDEFTRGFCEANGSPQEEDQPVETDAWGATQKPHAEGGFGIPKTYERMYRETMLGGGHVNANMQQFLEWDGKVCRFYAVIDDLNTSTFERRPFVILYFLADDTFQIREQYPLNCGRDGFPVFFKRGKIARSVQGLRGPLDQQLPSSEYIDVTELSVGAVQRLCGCDFFIYDADEFTRAYFHERCGRELAPKVDPSLPERTVARPPTPPYTGYGSVEDSLGSVYSLNPKPPKRDLEKLYFNDGKILRYTARFVNPKEEHKDRVFVVNYFLFDDTLSIHEPPQRNSGIVTGKFLEKGTHANGLTGKLFSQADLYAGAIIEVYNQRFEILGTDEYTAKFERNAEQPRAYDMDAVLEKVREAMRQKFPLVRDVFRKFDLDHNGVITQNEFREALKGLNIHLSKQDLLAIMRHFDTRQDGQVSYNEFCDAVCERDYTQTMLEPRKGLEKGGDEAYESRAASKEEERAETERVRKAVRDIGDIVYKHTQVKTRLTKEFGKITHKPTVSVQQIQEALGSLGFDVDLDDVIRAVLYTQPEADLAEVNYVDFLKALDTTFHENSNPR
jgi:hypothetical protein